MADLQAMPLSKEEAHRQWMEQLRTKQLARQAAARPPAPPPPPPPPPPTKQPAGSGPSMSLAKLGTSKRALSESNPKAKKKGLKGGKAAKGSSEASAWLAEHDVSLSDPDAPPPCVRLADAPFPASLVAKLVAQPGFSAPTAVQGAAWPVAAAGDDLLAISQTGSGKTLSYLLPALTRSLPKLQGAALVAARRQSEGAVSAGPTSLIMVPTRELALQVHPNPNPNPDPNPNVGPNRVLLTVSSRCPSYVLTATLRCPYALPRCTARRSSTGSRSAAGRPSSTAACQSTRRWRR